MVNVCVPVLNRYDLLRELLLSLTKSHLVPDTIYIIDNGRDSDLLSLALRQAIDTRVVTYKPSASMGVAESWNWFIDNVPQERLIVNDDITFAPESLEKIVAGRACFVSCSFGFSCFLLRDECVRLVGRFDESISPGYAYFEDRDYLRRMRIVGIQDEVVLCGVQHGQSKTLAAFTPTEMEQHHKKFVLAQDNFVRKWKQLPRDEMEGCPKVVRQFA